MASVYHLCDDADNFEGSICRKREQYSEEARRKYFAAVDIQKVWRSYVARKQIKYMHKMATLLQKGMRGWWVRWNLPAIYEETRKEKLRIFYSKKATKIQACYKGYKLRTTLCIRDLLRERRKMEEANESILQEMREKASTLSKFDETNFAPIIANALFDKHHLLRTEVKEGVLSKHGTDELSCMEQFLKQFKYTEYMGSVRKIYNQAVEPEFRYKYDNPKMRRMEDMIRLRDKDAIPITPRLPNEEFVQEKPFLLFTKVHPPKYTPIIDNPQKWQPIPDYPNLERSKAPTKAMLNYAGKAPSKLAKPYHVNFWIDKCKLHNVPDD